MLNTPGGGTGQEEGRHSPTFCVASLPTHTPPPSPHTIAALPFMPVPGLETGIWRGGKALPSSIVLVNGDDRHPSCNVGTEERKQEGLVLGTVD